MSQEFVDNVLDLVKQKEFCLYEYMSDYEKFKVELPSKKKFIVPWLTKKLVTKKMIVF